MPKGRTRDSSLEWCFKSLCFLISLLSSLISSWASPTPITSKYMLPQGSLLGPLLFSTFLSHSLRTSAITSQADSTSLPIPALQFCISNAWWKILKLFMFIYWTLFSHKPTFFYISFNGYWYFNRVRLKNLSNILDKSSLLLAHHT